MEAAGIVLRLLTREDDVAFTRRFSGELCVEVHGFAAEEREAVESGEVGELAELRCVGVVAFALSVERAVFRIPRYGSGCEKSHLPFVPVTASLPHKTLYCPDPECEARHTDPLLIVMDGLCDLCEAERSSTQIAYALAGWTVKGNICDACVKWAPRGV
jgi:hypothetical protein